MLNKTPMMTNYFRSTNWWTVQWPYLERNYNQYQSTNTYVTRIHAPSKSWQRDASNINASWIRSTIPMPAEFAWPCPSPVQVECNEYDHRPVEFNDCDHPIHTSWIQLTMSIIHANWVQLTMSIINARWVQLTMSITTTRWVQLTMSITKLSSTDYVHHQHKLSSSDYVHHQHRLSSSDYDHHTPKLNSND